MISVLLLLCFFISGVKVLDPTSATVYQLIKSAGYPVQKHRVATADGYILQVQRIPAGRRFARKSGATPKRKIPVLLMHGLMGSSSDFVIMGPNKSLAYVLADSGYDVWLGNVRGTYYSAHRSLDRTDPAFWDFSFHEHGIYDMPAIIDLVLNVTMLPKLMLIGYSMGGTSSFVMFSERPEYNDKVIAFVGLAPAVYLENMKAIAKFLFEDLKISEIMKLQTPFISAMWKGLTSLVAASFCSVEKLQDNICISLISIVMGDDLEQLDMAMIPIIASRVQPPSWKQMAHYGKVAITGVFTSWEGGLDGGTKPYNISNVKVPVTLLYGANDKLVEKSQILRVSQELHKNGVLEEVRPSCNWNKFNHYDFMAAKDIGTMFNKPLIGVIKNQLNKYKDKLYYYLFH